MDAGTDPHGPRDASLVARAGGLAFVGLVASRGVRVLVTWALSLGLGPAGFGLYTLATAVVTLLGLVAPLGLMQGVVLFGARHRADGDRARLKGVLLASLGLSGLAGAVLAGLVVAFAPQGARWFAEPDLASLLVLAAPAVFLLGWMGVLAGALRAARDVRGEVIVNEGALPLLLLAGSTVAVLVGAGTTGAVEAFVIAHALAVVFAWRRVRSTLREVFDDPAVRPVVEWAALLRYSLPQAVTDVLHKTLMWSDLLMLGILATAADVGRYRVALALAVVVALPAGAVTRIFDPLVAEMIQRGERDRLQDLMRSVTRWLAIAVMPLCVVLIVVPDLVLALFGAQYAEAAAAVGILLVGQVLFVVCTPANSAVLMAGHAVPNAVNGAVALAVNLALNTWLIPRYGYAGAATASATAFGVWSALRVVEAAWFLRVFPFDVRAVVAPVAVLGSAVVLRNAVASWPVPGRIGVVFTALLALALVSWVVAATPADRALARRLLRWGPA